MLERRNGNNLDHNSGGGSFTIPGMSEPTPITITTARTRDLRKVRTLQRRAFGDKLAYGFVTLWALCIYGGATFLVARRGEAILGCAIGDRHGDLSRVVNIAVDPDARRQGIGEQLLRALERALPEGDMLLLVQEENVAARALYEKTGYRSAGIARNYYGKGLDGIWMRKVRTRRGGEHIFV